MNTIEKILKELPPELQIEVEDFAKFLLTKIKKGKKSKPKFEWAGVLKDLKEDFTSVELQNEISHLRMGIK